MKIVVTLTLLFVVTLPASSSTPQAAPQDGSLLAATAPPLTFTFTDINVPGASETDAYDINNNVIAGDYIDSSGSQHGMILNGKKLTSTDCPAGGVTAFYGINSHGTALAQCGDGGDDGGYYIWVPGRGWVWVPVPHPGCPDCPYFGFGINDVQQVVGEYIDPNNLIHGFFVDVNKQTFQTLDVPGATATLAWGINNSGLITLQAADAAGLVHSYLFNGKTYKNIDVPGAAETSVHGINNQGDIVFTTLDSAGNLHGALLHAGRYYSFEDSKSNGATRADGVSDEVNGGLTIVGRYSPNPNSQQNYSFEATVK